MKDLNVLSDTKIFLEKQLAIKFNSQLDREIEFTILSQDEGFRNLLKGLPLKSWEALCFQAESFYFSESETRVLKDIVALRFSIIEAGNHFNLSIESGKMQEEDEKFNYLLNFYEDFLNILRNEVQEQKNLSPSDIKSRKIETSLLLSSKELENYRNRISKKSEITETQKKVKSRTLFNVAGIIIRNTKELFVSNLFRILILAIILVFSLFLSINYNLKYTFKYKKRIDANTMFSYSLVNDIYTQEDTLFCEVNKIAWNNLDSKIKRIFIDDIKDEASREKSKDIRVIDGNSKDLLFQDSVSDRFGKINEDNGLR